MFKTSNGLTVTPIGPSSKDGIFRAQVQARTVKDGIVMGKKSGFLEAVTAEGYEKLLSNLQSGELIANITTESVGNGNYAVSLSEKAAV